MIGPGTDDVTVRTPRELQKARTGCAKARARWKVITPKAQAAWAAWIADAKKDGTRATRAAKAVQRLSAGAERVDD